MGVEAELQVFLRASNKRELGRIVSVIRRAFPLELGEGVSERYWKDPGLYDVRFPVTVPPGALESAVFDLLKAAWILGGPWLVAGIGKPGNPGWEFEAIADHRSARISVPGLEWARISLLLLPIASDGGDV